MKAITDNEECIATLDTIVDTINPATGLTACFGKTLADVRAETPEYANAERMTVSAFCERKAVRQRRPITWAATTEERFMEMLEVLPPAAGSCGYSAFLVGEPWDHDALNGQPRFQAFRQKGQDYFKSSRPMTREEFRQAIALVEGGEA